MDDDDRSVRCGLLLILSFPYACLNLGLEMSGQGCHMECFGPRAGPWGWKAANESGYYVDHHRSLRTTAHPPCTIVERNLKSFKNV